MVLYRAEEYKTMELQRSIVVQKVELLDNIKNLLAKDVSSMANPDEHYEKLSKAIKKCKLFNVSDPLLDDARALIFDYIESRIDPETKAMLEAAKAHVDPYGMAEGLAIADREGYETQLVKECQKLYARMQRIIEEADVANETYEEKHMEVVLKAADEIGLYNEHVEGFRTLLYQTELQARLKILIGKAKELCDAARALRLTIRIKESVFSKQAAMFEFKNFGCLKSAEDWAGEKFLTLSRDKLREGYLMWTSEQIHTSMTSTLTTKDQIKTAQTVFGLIQVFMGDRKEGDPDSAGEAVVRGGFQHPEMRDETLCQIIKQLTLNPNPGSIARGWNLLGACIASFPPSQMFENYLEVYLKQKAPSPNYVGALHNVVYNGARPTYVTKAEFTQIDRILHERTEEYAEKLPEGLPRWYDLEVAFDPNVDVEFKRAAPKAQKLAAGKKAAVAGGAAAKKDKGAGRRSSERLRQTLTRESPWKEILDDASGQPYYWNEITGESTWDCPPDFKYAATKVGVRI